MAARGAAVLSCAAALALCVYAFLPKSTAGLLLYEGQFSEVQLVNSMINASWWRTAMASLSPSRTR